MRVNITGWWESFVDENSAFMPIRWMYNVKMNMIGSTRYFTYLLLSMWKVVAFFLTTWLIVSLNGLLVKPINIFDKFMDSFDSHPFNVTEKTDVIFEDDYTNSDAIEVRLRAVLFTVKNSPLWVMLIQIGASYIAYIFAKFASKVQIQGMF